MENAKTEKFKCDILGDFQTLCCCCSGWYSCLRFHLNPLERSYVVINRWWVSKALIQMNLNAKKEQKGKSDSLHVYLWSEIWMNLYPINRVKYIINWRQMHGVLNEPSTRVVFLELNSRMRVEVIYSCNVTLKIKNVCVCVCLFVLDQRSWSRSRSCDLWSWSRSFFTEVIWNGSDLVPFFFGGDLKRILI